MSEITVKNIDEITVASVSHIGPYWELTDAFEKLTKFIAKNSVKITGAPMGIYYDNPKEVSMDKLRSEAVIPVDPKTVGGDDVKIVKLPAVKVVSLLYIGSYADINKLKAYETLYNYIDVNGLTYASNLPLREIYLNSPTEVKAEELKTEIQCPIN